MRYLLVFICLCLFFPLMSSAVNMEMLIKKDKKAAEPVFPTVDSGNFKFLCNTAQGGDTAAQQQLIDFQLKYIRSVYKPLELLGGLLFSVREPKKGYETAAKNYAVNLNSFFDETSGRVCSQKQRFEVKTKTGSSCWISFLEYRSYDDSVKVKAEDNTQWIPLADLTECDRRFVQNALADEAFESSGEFDISISDKRLNDILKDVQSRRVDGVHKGTGEHLTGSFETSSMDGIQRVIILENNGNFPLENLVVEYQSFVEQTLMRMPKDTPTDYCCVGCIEVKSLAPGERKEIRLDLPATVDTRTQTISTGDYEYYIAIPSDQNQRSAGRTNGIRIKVHRLTPYGEKLTREYESSNVPSTEWTGVVPVSANIR